MRILNTHYEDVPPENSLTPEEIEQICCTRVPVDECSEVGRVSDYNGASQDDIDQDDLLEQARADNPGKRILGVRIEDIGRPGKPCGKKRETWQGHLNCCDFVEPMSWDYDSSVQVLAPGTSGIVFVNGGASPYHWSVRGEGFTLNGYNMRDGFTDLPYVRIYAGPFACGWGPIEVTDGCSVVRGGVKSTLGSWSILGNFRPYDVYLSMGIVRSQTDNEYSSSTGIPCYRESGQYALSYRTVTPFDDGSFLIAKTGNLVADSDITGVIATDPILGIFSWVACSQCYLVYPIGYPYNWWRPFMAIPPQNELYVLKWVC